MNRDEFEFAVFIWRAGNGRQDSLFEKGYWQEMARCITAHRADEVALCLSLRHPAGVQVARLETDKNGSRFVGYRYYPPEARYRGRYHPHEARQRDKDDE
jgi:hypothetical protein